MILKKKLYKRFNLKLVHLVDIKLKIMKNQRMLVLQLMVLKLINFHVFMKNLIKNKS